MAGNSNSGRTPVFELSEKELASKIQQYKQDLEDGCFARASWPHFASYIGCLEDELREFIAEYSDKKESAYYRRARMLREVLQFIRGEIFSSKAWTGQQAQLAKLHGAKDYGDGIVYKEKESGNGPSSISILFGDGDPRSAEAAK